MTLDGGKQELIVGPGEALVLVDRDGMSAGHDATISENTISIRVPFSRFPEFDIVKLGKCFKFNKKVGGKHIWSEKKL